MSTLTSVVPALAILAGMLVCLEIGYRCATRVASLRVSPVSGPATEAALFALLTLLLGFAYAGASARLEARRAQVVEEANAIGTAYLRLDLLADDERERMRPLFREYVAARREVYQGLGRTEATRAYARASAVQRSIWDAAVDVNRRAPAANAPRLLIPAVNEMFDVAMARSIMSATHLPTPVLLLLAGIALLSALVAGLHMGSRDAKSWLHALLFAGAVALTVYVVLDLDQPRAGFIRVGVADEALRLLEESIRE